MVDIGPAARAGFWADLSPSGAIISTVGLGLTVIGGRLMVGRWVLVPVI